MSEKAREPTVSNLVRRMWRLRVSEAERRVREVEDSHRDNKSRSGDGDTFIAESAYLALNSLWHWKPMKFVNQGSDVAVSSKCFLSLFLICVVVVVVCLFVF